ncbi:MAG: hypothetical protein JXA01_10755 [Dehalococcoidia bacterium]|nr:hypothetical protein [Dehalococcoidia bacterium]
MKRCLLAVICASMLLAGCITFQVTSPYPNQQNETAPVILLFNSNPAIINAGETSTLQWKVTGATSVSIDQGIGQVNASGSMMVSPARSTSFTISAINSSGTATALTTITVNPVPASSAPSVSQPATTPAISQPSMPTFAVTNVTAGTEKAGYSSCYNLYADITANGAGTVSYRWESTEGGGYSYTWTIEFSKSGTQRITLPAEMRALPSGNYQLHIMSPNDVLSNITYYTTCQ